MSEPTSITFGPEHGPTVRALLGEGARNIDNCVWETPRWAAWERRDGTVVQLLERSFSTLVYEYSDYLTWMHARNARLDTVRDPETGRVR
jgi:hypothetical protein